MATIYPPIVNNSLSAFSYNRSSYAVYFSLPTMVSLSDVQHILIKVVKQANNKSIVNTSLYPDGIIYKDKVNIVATDDAATSYYISILRGDISEDWSPGTLYKIQLRFGARSLYSSVKDFATWKKTQIDEGTFSEWSTVMVVKAIDTPIISIKNAGRTSSSTVITSLKSETTITPLFYGSYEISGTNKEYVDKYKFDLYQDNKLIESSGWLQHDSNNDVQVDTSELIQSFDTYRFATVLTNLEEYSVNYTILTINGYEASPAELYEFLVALNYLSQLEDVVLTVDSDSEFCYENGCIRVYLTNTSPISGNFVLTRSSEKTNYAIWEDLSYLLYFDETFDNLLIYTDYTIESGIKYRYAFQQENRSGLRTAPLYEEPIKSRSVDFLYSYLYNNGVLLKLQYNLSLSSFKHTVLSSKQDTLGSKYASILRNGNAYYAEFPISGLISLHMDEDLTFFTIGRDGYYYNGELVIPTSRYEDALGYNMFNNNLTDNNFFMEKVFRDKVEEFLNDGGYKLYKSATEGNIIVTLMNVSLKPVESLGRMLFEFSATAYEVLEFNLDNLNEYGLIEIGDFLESYDEDTSTELLGQISGLYTGNYTISMSSTGARVMTANSSPDNLWAEIKKLNEYNIGGGYRYDFRKIKYLWIEQYPKLEFKSELQELKALLADAKNNNESTSEIEAEIETYNALVAAAAAEPEYSVITLVINGREISLGKNKVYSLDDIEENIQSIVLKYTGPILINYVCEVGRTEDEELGIISSIESTKIWGQIAGIFTDTPKVLTRYNYKYRDFDYRVDNLNDTSTNFDLFNKLNILDIVKEEVRAQVEDSYGTKFTEYNEETKLWNDGSLYYTFTDIISLEIEAEENTILLIKRFNSDAVRDIIIGPTNKYVLNSSEGLISYLAFKDPTFAIINYRCLTSLMET